MDLQHPRFPPDGGSKRRLVLLRENSGIYRELGDWHFKPLTGKAGAN